MANEASENIWTQVISGWVPRKWLIGLEVWARAYIMASNCEAFLAKGTLSLKTLSLKTPEFMWYPISPYPVAPQSHREPSMNHKRVSSERHLGNEDILFGDNGPLVILVVWYMFHVQTSLGGL